QLVIEEEATNVLGFIATPETGQGIGHRHGEPGLINHRHMGGVARFDFRSCTIVSGCTLCRSRLCRVRIGLDISELIGGYLNKFGISEVLTYALIGGLPRLRC